MKITQTTDPAASGFRLILVEDSEVDRAAFRRHVDQVNSTRSPYTGRWSIVEFDALEQAIEHLDRPPPIAKPTVLVCDLDFSGCHDGVKLIEYATNLSVPIPCLVLSQSTDREIRSQCLRAGALAFVSKIAFDDMSAQDLKDLIIDVYCLAGARTKANKFSDWRNVLTGSVTLGHDLSRALQENLEVVQRLTDEWWNLAEAERSQLKSAIQDGHDFVETIVRDFTEATHLINEPLPPVEIFCVRHLLERVLSRRHAFWQKRYHKDSLTVIIDAPPECRCLCSETRVRRALANIIDNAVKFSPGAVDIVIRIYEYQEGEEGSYWAIEVTDNGPGVAKDELALLARPLVRLARTRNLPGSGFGLHSSVDLLRPYSSGLGGESNPRFRPASSGGLEVTMFVPKHIAEDAAIQEEFDEGVNEQS